MNINIKFFIDKTEALGRIKKLIPELKEEYKGQISDITEKWNGDNADFGFKIMGFSINGIFNISDDNLNISAKLPFAALPFKGTIEKLIREKSNELLKA